MAGSKDEPEPGAHAQGAQGGSEDAARARRELASSALARLNASSPSATASGRMSALTPTGASGRPRGRMLQLALAGIFLVAVVTALAIHFVPKGRTTSAAAPPAAPLQFLGASSRLLCPLDAAWSPNGA